MSNVLIIEDDEDLRPMLAAVLRSEGFSVSEAVDGAAGLATATMSAPDIVITDIVMEGMEGIAAIMALRRKLPGVPILAISGNVLYLDNSRKLGADTTLLKPFTRGALLDAVARLLASGSPLLPA